MTRDELNVVLFLSAYHEVFDDNKKLITHDNDKYQKLIIAANNAGYEEYGDLDFCRLNVDAIFRLYDEVNYE